MLEPLERGALRWRGKWTSPLIQHPRGAARAVRGDGDLVGTGEGLTEKGRLVRVENLK